MGNFEKSLEGANLDAVKIAVDFVNLNQMPYEIRGADYSSWRFGLPPKNTYNYFTVCVYSNEINYTPVAYRGWTRERIKTFTDEQATPVIMLEGIFGEIMLFVTETGKIFTERGDRLPCELADLIDYLQLPSTDFPVIIDERIFEFLREAGWYEGRKIGASPYIKNINFTREQKGYPVPNDFAVKFYEEFGELLVRHPKNSNNDIDTCIADWKGIYPTSKEVYNYVCANSGNNFYISDEGKMYNDVGGCLGRHFIESWNYLLRDFVKAKYGE